MGSMLPYIAAPWILWVYIYTIYLSSIYLSLSLSLCQKNRQLLELRTHESCDSFGTTWFSLEDPTAQPPSGGWFLLSETDAQRLPRLAVAPRASGHWAEDGGRRWTSHICDGLYNSGWWFGTWLLFFHMLGISSSQLTNSIIFQRGRAQPPTRISIANTGHLKLCQIGDGLHCTHNLAYFSVASPARAARVVVQGMKKNYFAERMLDMECPSKVVPQFVS